MGMVVSITNITDAPESKQTPTRLAIYTALLDPGETLTLPASMVDARLRKLEKDGLVVIGQLPSWYEASKMRKVGRSRLTQEELEQRRTTKPKAKEEPKAEAAPTEAPKEESAPVDVFSMEVTKKKTYKLDELDVPKTDKK